jgi:hypothetical protein
VNNHQSIHLSNPFSVTSPEHLSAGDAVDLFVDVFSDFPKIPNPGHVFLQGPRGSGKSMIFRYLKPDCQRIVKKCRLSELPFLAIYTGIRNSELNLTELVRLEERKHASTIINEHFMVMFMASIAFKQLAEICSDLDNNEENIEQAKSYVQFVDRYLKGSGSRDSAIDVVQPASVSTCFEALAEKFLGLYRSTITYIRSLAFPGNDIPYKDILCGYLDFLYPILCKLKELSFVPHGPIYLLVDDADNLNLIQTTILNTWVSTRTSSNVSLKVSSQFKYKTYYTVQGITVESPHDYSEVNIQTIYTAQTKRGTYQEMVREIVKKRLARAGIKKAPEEFFPQDREQEAQIKAIAAEYRKNWDKEGRGNRPGDDALRYARPDFIKNLAGPRKASSSYSYAGFLQLVHLSSGIIRYFLEAASLMYSEVLSSAVGKEEKEISEIPPSVQDKVVRQQAYDFLFKELEKISADESEEAPPPDLLAKLGNLIQALGGTFRKIILSDRSERRVFSIAFSNMPSDDVKEVFRLGVELGYFHQSTIGNKEGTGRTTLYILNRRLAPNYNLDPTSFAGYLFVTNESLVQAIYNPQALLRKIDDAGIDAIFEQRQLSLL